jgi:hypothetical protein
VSDRWQRISISGLDIGFRWTAASGGCDAIVMCLRQSGAV